MVRHFVRPALALVLACSPPKAPAARGIDALSLDDGHLEVPNDGALLGLGHSPDEIGALLAAAGLPRDPIRLDIHCLLVRTHDRVLLFDTGMGEATLPATGHLLESLAHAKLAPPMVTDIFISHAHSDHVGGLVTKDHALAFPNATIHISAPDWTLLQADSDPDSPRFVRIIAPRVAPFEPGAQLLPEVRAVATPGHTPGHSSYEISSGAEHLFYLGDLAHHAIISV
ncbi:MAG TPA: MBL fold metallo-hydrolase, partial [Kofleriaceae bacterium]